MNVLRPVTALLERPSWGQEGPFPLFRSRSNSLSMPERFFCLFVRQRFSDVADVRQHLRAEQFERFHQCVGIFRARGLERQIDDAAADLCAALFQLRDDLVQPAEIDRQCLVDIGRPSSPAGDVALVDLQQRGGDPQRRLIWGCRGAARRACR
jgi:hypothetical protein